MASSSRDQGGNGGKGILQYQLSNGDWIDAAGRTDEFLALCEENNGPGPDGTIVPIFRADRPLTRDEVIAALMSGRSLRNDRDDWYSNCRAKPAPQPETVATAPKRGGQLWEPCESCGREPVYLPLHLCEHCWPR